MELKKAIRSRVDSELARTAKPDRRPLEEKLILACRMLGAAGHWQGGLAGQITARGVQPGTYWTLKFGIGADEATLDDLILVDDDLRPLHSAATPNPATRFHLWVYRARQDVHSIVHTHPPATSALSITGQPLVISHMDSTPFFDNCAYLRDWPGLPIADSEGAVISRALGSKKTLLLAHHGLLTAGNSIEESAVLALWLEQAAAVQLRAAAVGPITPVKPELARESRDFLLKPEIIALTFQYFARRALHLDRNCLDRDHVGTPQFELQGHP